MSQIAEAAPAAPAALSPMVTEALPAIGSAFHGGYFVGQIRVHGVLYGLIMAGVEGELSGRWASTDESLTGAESTSDGLHNTAVMALAGSKLAQRVMDLSLGGFGDWYIPSCDELEMAYRNFKPSTTQNYTYSGENESSIPAAPNYTLTAPAQTTVAALIEDEADALVPAWYWSSTQFAADPTSAWDQSFGNGNQDNTRKSYAGRVRAVRRFVIQ